MAGRIGGHSLARRLSRESKEHRKRKQEEGRGACNLFILDTSESMKGEGCRQMQKAFASIIEGYATHSTLDENVAVIQFGREVKFLQYFSNNYVSLMRLLDDLSCSGPSPMIEGFLLAISALECGRRFTNIGPFNCRARVILISNGKTISSTDLDSEYRVTENEDQNIQLLDLVRRIGMLNPITCVPVGNDPNISLLRSIAYGSRGGKILHYEEATQFAKYSLNMMIAGDILGEVPPTFCTIDDVKSLVFSTRFQHVVTERDLEDVVEILNNRRVYEINVYPNEEQLELHEYTERDERLPPPGTRVRRGPCWPYNDQNSGGLGTIIGHSRYDGGVNVEWDNTLKFPYQYDPDDQRLCSVIVCDEPRILQREEIAVGCVVKRGPDWKWGNQDGGASNIGAVYRVKEDVVYVRWPNGNKSNYRFGYDGKFDIVVCDPFDVSRIVSSPTCKNLSKYISDRDVCVKNGSQARTEIQLESFVKKELSLDGNQRIHSKSIEDLDCDEDDFSWEWKTENGQWKPFSKTENQKIIKAIEKNSKSTILIEIGEQMYRVILSKMTLLNILTRETFDVRCREKLQDLQA